MSNRFIKSHCSWALGMALAISLTAYFVIAAVSSQEAITHQREPANRNLVHRWPCMASV